MLEGDLLHQRPSLRVEERLLAIVVRRQHKCLPSLVVRGRHGAVRQGLLQHARHDEGHGVVRRLARLRVLLCGVPNNSKGRLVGDNVDVLNRPDATCRELWVVHQRRDQALQGTRRLVLVEAQLEVHPADGKVIAGVREHEVEGARAHAPAHLVAQGDVDVVLARGGASGWLEEAEDRLGVAEDVLGPHEAAHGAAHGEDRRLSGDRGGGALGV
mmetsp:Transcript_91273/g.258512  ORF Transcript_91273/g.258512 Transcript_91273/m.258512 type:complete len:214 (+) Transcript_91273:615-1256(+)